MKFEKPLTISQLLEIIPHEVVVKGNASNVMSGMNEIHSVEAGDLSFVDIPKYYEKTLSSVASVILINKETDCPEGKTLIITNDPFGDYVQVVRHFVHFHPQTELIHPNAVIGENTIIQPNTFIGENVVIGKNCIIHANVSIYSDTVIGDNVIIHSGAVIGADAYYFQKRTDGWKKLESCGHTVIGNDVEVGCGVMIDRGVSGVTYIGDGTKFDNLTQVGHDTYIGKRCLISAMCAIAGCTRIEDDCTIWGKSAINKDLVVAKNTTLLAFSALDKSVTEENSVLLGIPAYDARKRWKEIACGRMLPELVEEIGRLKAEIEKLKK
ncbi:MAG: UDP-3-O-(3-hydroxymyristoyl)glucosamine N-acyltransferase [Bacteroidales bacterium]|jgi:UDP-3-O-[3-hydroxymyristoyl] glucosamine N-acyltransferase|nr:UDP-3-O-(3-hydroxymyristoyl)glucosamine N-acyltransferase [Bacteroidales bacterium]